VVGDFGCGFYRSCRVNDRVVAIEGVLREFCGRSRARGKPDPWNWSGTPGSNRRPSPWQFWICRFKELHHTSFRSNASISFGTGSVGDPRIFHSAPQKHESRGPIGVQSPLLSVAAVAWLKGPQPEFFSFEEAERVLDAADPEWRPMFTLALRTGLRIGELRALRWDDVDLVAGRMVVRRCDWRGHLGTPKSGRNRELPLSPGGAQDAAASQRRAGLLRGRRPRVEGERV
jgi:hypothetical protein